jgi:ATPase subunit of ABC transporter with duplicated ATPase domains
MLILQDIAYIHPNKDLLFDNINLIVSKQEKVALIGNNGSGKSTLLKMIAGELQPSAGNLSVAATPYYVPQVFGQFNHLTVAQALSVANKLNALKEILNGNATEHNLTMLDDDWTIEERCHAALSYWKLGDLDLARKMGTLSGGQKTKVFLSGISIHQAALTLLDEPSNHLDTTGRAMLYDFIQSTTSTLIVVSHDRKLLNRMYVIHELNKRGITSYGGNYDFYAIQKQIENNALNQTIQQTEKALRKAREKERETLERQQKLDARGKKKQEKAGVARIMMNTLRNNAEKSTSKIKGVHAEKIAGISNELHGLRSTLPDIDQMKFGLNDPGLHKGKVLVAAKDINYRQDTQMLWKNDLNFQITSGERIALKGSNGSGKTTLIKLIFRDFDPSTGTIYRSNCKAVYLDQDYSLINNAVNIYEQAQEFNTSLLPEHEIKIRLNRFLFTKAEWDKPCSTLSGGERMRLTLCCLTIDARLPDLVVLDEPTNNLDLQNIEMLTAAIREYRGTLIVVSHDEMFLQQIGVGRTIVL